VRHVYQRKNPGDARLRGHVPSVKWQCLIPEDLRAANTRTVRRAVAHRRPRGSRRLAEVLFLV
jgi:hypothetical protein